MIGPKMKTNLQPDIIRNFAVLYESSDKSKIRVAGSGVCNLDLFYAALDKSSEEHRFLCDGHRVGEGLIAVAQVS